MYYVYILQSQYNKRFYVGSTNDVQKRIIKHNNGAVRSTKAYCPWKVVRVEGYDTRTQARKRELQIKNKKSRKIILLVTRGIIGGDKLIPLTDITGTHEADIEDLFDPDFYVDLLNASGTVAVNLADLTPTGRILRRIEVAANRKFDHFQPASYLMQHQAALLPKLSPATLDRFEALFKKANALLS